MKILIVNFSRQNAVKHDHFKQKEGGRENRKGQTGAENPPETAFKI